jgi:hypothetical protein
MKPSGARLAATEGSWDCDRDGANRANGVAIHGSSLPICDCGVPIRLCDGPI